MSEHTGLARHPGLYRAQLACKIGRDALEGKITPPNGVTPMEWAMFNLLHAIEEIATAMMPNDKVEPRRDSDVGSDALFGVSVVKSDGFRSQPYVNTDEDMVRVTLDMPKHIWRKLQKRLTPNAKVDAPIGATAE